MAQYCYAYPRLDDPGPLGSADAGRQDLPRRVVRHEPLGRSFLTGGWFCWRRRYADLAHPTQRMRPV